MEPEDFPVVLLLLPALEVLLLPAPALALAPVAEEAVEEPDLLAELLPEPDEDPEEPELLPVLPVLRPCEPPDIIDSEEADMLLPGWEDEDLEPEPMDDELLPMEPEV